MTKQTILLNVFALAAAVVLPSAVSAQTAYFSIANGEIYDPQGNLFVPHGINVGSDEMAAAVAQGGGNPLLAQFPGLNYIRLNTGASNPGTPQAVYPTPDQFDAFVNQMTAAHVVVEIEDHSCYGGTLFNTSTICAPFTNGALDTQNNWYTALATHFASNPYVWLGTLNEPNSSDGTYQPSSIGAVSAQQLSNYNTIRATGNNTIINMLAGIGGGNTGTVGANGGFVVSDYAAMHNIFGRSISTPTATKGLPARS